MTDLHKYVSHTPVGAGECLTYKAMYIIIGISHTYKSTRESLACKIE